MRLLINRHEREHAAQGLLTPAQRVVVRQGRATSPALADLRALFKPPSKQQIALRNWLSSVCQQEAVAEDVLRQAWNHRAAGRQRRQVLEQS